MRTIVRTPAPDCLAAQSEGWGTFMGTPCHGEEKPDPNLVISLRQDYLDADANGPLQSFYSLSRTILEPSPSP